MQKALAVFESLLWPWQILFLTDPFNNKDRWIGPRPTFALWIKFLWQTGMRLSHHARLALLDFDSLKTIQENNGHFGDQAIEEHTENDRDLLKNSSLSLRPHEVYQIRIHSEEGEACTGPLRHGGIGHCSTLKDLACLIRQLCLKARKQGLSVTEVEIAHTHPSLEVLVVEEDRSRFVFNGLSKRDKETGETLAQFLDYPLRIKAITPAVSYSMIF